VQEVQSRRAAEQDDGKLPGPMFSPEERARDHHESESERRDERSRDALYGMWRQLL